MNNIFKILSIDFDFFQNVDRNMLSIYPDGIDLPPDLSGMVWASHYMNSVTSDGRTIDDVAIDIANLWDMMQNIIPYQRYITPVMICHSHKHIYEFIHDCLPDTSRPLSVTNIDLHHDMFNDHDFLDCGNWLRYIKDEYKDFKQLWIPKRASMDMYGLSDVKDVDEVTYDLSVLDHKKFDAVFLCRSDMWLPPHLDRYFISLATKIINSFKTVIGEDSVLKERDYKGDMMAIKQAYEYFSEHEDEYEGSVRKVLKRRYCNGNSNTAS